MGIRTRGILSFVRRSATIVVAIAITLVATEHIIRIVAPQPLHYYDFELRDGGAALVAGDKVAAREILPPGQGPYTPGIEYWMGPYLVRINSKGWRDVEHTLDKPSNVVRLGVIGDSVTFGTGAAIDSVFFRVLEDLLKDSGYANIEILGFAGGAANAYFARMLAEDLIDAYDLDAIILGFNQNDVLPSATVAAGKAKAAKPRQLIASTMAGMADRLLRADSHLFHLFRERSKAVLRRVGIVDPGLRLQAFLRMEDERAVQAWNDTRLILSEMHSDLAARNIPFIILVLPIDIQTGPTIADMYRSDGFAFSRTVEEGLLQRKMRSFATEQGIILVDPLPSFQEDENLTKFIRTEGGSIDWAHLSPVGHRIVAENILDVLLSNSEILKDGAARSEP